MSIAHVTELMINVNQTYTILEEVGRGGWGVVHRAIRQYDNKEVALKFFGYTTQTPDRGVINTEIMLMMSLHGVEGTIQLISVFYDTGDGLLPNKTITFLQPYPVIVMEPVVGGTLLQKTIYYAENQMIQSERQHATIFRRVIIALQSIHARNYIHRDIKLANIMFTTTEEDSPIKIIDYGLLVELRIDQNVYLSQSIDGTDGLIAPESLDHKLYSFKSDVWQAGCALFTLLCQHPPFYPGQLGYSEIRKGQLCESIKWNSLSDDAKDLIRKMLTVDPEQRISTNDILAHPWFPVEV